MYEVLSRALASDRFKDRKRVGRGVGSGTGKTAGRGSKGAGSRAGYQARPAFEGGQKQLFRRVAKRGFNNRAFEADRVGVPLHFAARYCVDGVVSAEYLRDVLGLGRKTRVVIIGAAEVQSGLEFRGVDATAGARACIERCGAKLAQV